MVIDALFRDFESTGCELGRDDLRLLLAWGVAAQINTEYLSCSSLQCLPSVLARWKVISL